MLENREQVGIKNNGRLSCFPIAVETYNATNVVYVHNIQGEDRLPIRTIVGRLNEGSWGLHPVGIKLNFGKTIKLTMLEREPGWENYLTSARDNITTVVVEEVVKEGVE